MPYGKDPHELRLAAVFEAEPRVGHQVSRAAAREVFWRCNQGHEWLSVWWPRATL